MTSFTRIFILALDGLDYDLVKHYKLQSLLQRVHGYIDVSNFKHILTPIIWASFITGKTPDDHKIYSWWRFSKYDSLDKLVHWIRYHFPLIKNLSSSKIKHILSTLGLKVRPTSRLDLKIKTIFDHATRPIALFVPSYNEEPKIRDRYSKAFERGYKEFEKVLWEVHHYRKEKVISKITEDWDLFMAWFDLADWMGHLYMGRSGLKMLKTYLELAKLAKKLSTRMCDKTLFMIVSDHGIKPDGEHSNKAFYSFSKDISWKPKRITDYYYFITDLLSKRVKHA